MTERQDFVDSSRLRMRLMRGIKSQLAVETANRSHFDDEAWLQLWPEKRCLKWRFQQFGSLHAGEFESH